MPVAPLRAEFLCALLENFSNKEFTMAKEKKMSALMRDVQVSDELAAIVGSAEGAA